MKWLREYIKKNPGNFSLLFRIWNIVFSRSRIRGRSGNKIRIGVSMLKRVRIEIQGTGNEIIIGDLCQLVGLRITISGNNNKIEIGNRCVMLGNEMNLEHDNNRIIVGDNVYIQVETNFSLMEGTSLTVGSDCMIAGWAHIRTSDAHPIFDTDGVRLNPARNVIIGSHVWIALRTTILKGTTVAEGCLVGACALLNSEYTEPNCIIVGNPAKVVRQNIRWERDLSKR